MKPLSVPDWYYKFLLAIVLLGGLMLRLYGVNYGLPFLYHADEGLFVQKAGLILANRDLNPHWFGAPGTTIIYTLCLIFTSLFLIGRTFGAFNTPGEFRDFFYHDPTIFYLTGRVAFVVIGVASLIMLWMIARRVFSRSTALVVVVLFALNPLHIFHSKIIRPDILLTFFMLLAFWFCIEIQKKQTWFSYIFAGLFSGLAIVTKYPGIISAVLVAAAFVMNKVWRKTEFLKLAASGIACVLAAFAASPFLFLDFTTVLKDVAQEARLRHLGATGEGILQNLAWYVLNPLLGTFTLGGILLAAVGLLLCIKSRKKFNLLLVAFVVLFSIFISGLSLRWERWIIPIFPFVCILAGYGWDWVIAKMHVLLRPRIAQWVSIGILCGITIPLLKADLIQGREMSNKDTRTIAREWILGNIPAGSSLLIEEWAPQLPKERYKFFEIRSGELTEVNVAEIDLAAFRPKGRVGALKDLDAIHRQKVEYLVLSNWYDRFVAEKNKYPDYAQIVAVYDRLIKNGSKIYEVKRKPGFNRGSTIRVYKVS
jgi:hypothetical protein